MNFSRTGKKILNSLSPIAGKTGLNNLASYNRINLPLERHNIQIKSNQDLNKGKFEEFNYPTNIIPKAQDEQLIIETLFSNTKDSFTDRFIWGRNNNKNDDLMENEYENEEEIEAKANEDEEDAERNKKDESDNDDDDDGNGGLMMPVVEWIGGLIPRVAKAI